MIISLFPGCSVLQKIGLQKSDNDELQPASSMSMGEEEASKISDKKPIPLYFANDNSTKLKLETRYILTSEANKSVNHLAGIVIKELINGPKNSNLKRTIPKETKLKSPVSIKGKVATVDLSKEFVDKHPGGKEAELLTIFSIVNSLTRIKDIEKVRFLINGKSREAYKGNFKFDIPFAPDPSLISNDVALPSPSTTGDSKDKTDTVKKGNDKDGTGKNETDKDQSKKDGTNKDNTVKSSPSKTSDSGEDLNDSDPSFADGVDDPEAIYWNAGDMLE
jgi:hypothetical protein